MATDKVLGDRMNSAISDTACKTDCQFCQSLRHHLPNVPSAVTPMSRAQPCRVKLMSQQSGHRAMRCLNQALLCIVAFPWAVSGGWITGSLVGSIPLDVGMSCDDMIWGMIHFVNFFLFEIITLGKLKNSPFVFVCGCVSVFPLDNGDVPLPRE